MKVLLFGKNGQVGWELQRSLAPLGEVIALDRHSSEHCGDLSDLAGIAATVHAVRPDVVVNAAAYTAVDRAESEREQAFRINGQAPAVLAEAARRIGAWIVHFSTDYVFDGSGSRPWNEDDVPRPLNVYGHSKLAGEQGIAQACDHHLVFRTCWVHAARGGNFLRTMLRLAREREELSVVSDQFGAPTGAELIADVTAHAARTALRGDAAAGIYHLSAAGETNWHGYAKLVIETARRSAAGAIRTGHIEAVPSSAYPTAARRPHNSRLDLRKTQHAFGLSLPPWQAGVERVVAELGWASPAN